MLDSPGCEKRPGDVIGAAVMIGRIAAGEIEGAKADVDAVRATKIADQRPFA